jgi:hypothetical protein
MFGCVYVPMHTHSTITCGRERLYVPLRPGLLRVRLVSGAFGLGSARIERRREGARAPPAGGAHSGAREEPESGAAWESRWCGSRTANILCRATRHALRAALAALHHGVQLALEGVRAHALHVDSLLHAEL